MDTLRNNIMAGNSPLPNISLLMEFRKFDYYFTTNFMIDDILMGGKKEKHFFLNGEQSISEYIVSQHVKN